MKNFRDFLIPPKGDIRVKVFNILAVGGFVVSIVTAIINLCEGLGILSALACFSGTFFSAGMMYYTRKTGDYRRAMVLTVLLVFIGLFSALFFMNGGYRGGFPYFFVLSVVYTAFLLDGVIVPVLILIELVWYALLCYYAFENPLAINPLGDEKVMMMDVVVCQTIVSVIIATTMYFQIREYRKKQKELNKAMRLAEEANRAKSDFLAKMSHDIRTPLNTIMATNEMIVSNTSSATIKEWVNDSNISARILLSLIDDMLDLTRIEAGKVALINQPWNTKTLFDETARIWKIQADKKGLEFEYVYDDSVPEYLMGDDEAIRKIVNNLLSNAVKYTKSGRITLIVKRAEDLEITVSDTGVGIAPEYLKKVFKPFERGVQDVYRETSGSGLGLAIVKELVDALEGSIECRSTLNKGTTFFAQIPQETCNDENTVKLKEAGAQTENQYMKQFIAPNARILVVDDNPFNRKVIGGFLEPTLIQTDDVESGFEALEMIDIKDYDLVLMDLRMPKMDGAETLERIRKEYPDFDTPVVVLTADIMNGVEEKLLQKGFAGFLAKPVSSAKLYEMLGRFISAKMVPLEAKGEKRLTLAEVEMYQDILLPYGVNLKLALEYSAGNSSEVLTRAVLFSQYASSGMERLLWPESTDNYYLQIHSLKSGAKGVGAYILAELAETVEFRKDEEFRREINPIIISEYRRVCEGLNTLLKEVEQ